MSRLLTPKQVSRAIGVSESTLKRWCDRGRIPVTRTAGGHRRLRQEDVLQLVRSGEIPFENPDALGLPPASGKGSWTLARAAEEVTNALLDGECDRMHQAVVDLFLCGHRLSAICDAVLAPALAEIGRRWESDSIDIYQERRAVGFVARTLHSMQALIPPPAIDAPLAVGGAVTGDIYSLPTMMVEVVLQEEGWRATSLGGHLPFASLRAALVEYSPRLLWLSVSHVADQEWFLSEYATLFENCPASTAIVIGGRAIDVAMRGRMRFAAHCDSLGNLSDFAQALRPPASIEVGASLV